MNWNIYLGIISPTDMVIGAIIYFFITITAFYLILKNEKTYFIFLWIFLSVFLPFLGSIIYIVKYFINKKINVKQPV